MKARTKEQLIADLQIAGFKGEELRNMTEKEMRFHLKTHFNFDTLYAIPKDIKFEDFIQSGKIPFMVSFTNYKKHAVKITYHQWLECLRMGILKPIKFRV